MSLKVTNSYHIPVMMQECIEGLNLKSDGIYVDATYGGGGHSEIILNELGPDGKLVAFDQDPDALNNVPTDDRLIFINHNFQFLTNFLNYYNISKVDGILADLGISSHQINEGSRGFSFRSDAPLDMRMHQSGKLNARQIVNTYDVEELSRIFRIYGEIRFGWKLSQKIVAVRNTKDIETTGELSGLISEFAPPHQRNKANAQVFQALRIEVNDEMGSLHRFLSQSITNLNRGGRLVVMSYHSLEDRLVKNYMSSGNAEGTSGFDAFGRLESPMKPISRKPIVPGDKELESNPRSRSAKLRIAEKR